MATRTSWQRNDEIVRLRHTLLTAAMRYAATAFAKIPYSPEEVGELDAAACALADKLREPEVCTTCGSIVPSGKHARTSRTAGLAEDIPRNT